MKVAPLLWGIVIYAVVFLFWNIAIVYGIANGLIGALLSFGVMAITVFIATYSVRVHTVADIVPYALLWSATCIVLDGVLNIPLNGFSVFLDSQAWVGYALIAILPPISQLLTRRIPNTPTL